jgi:hypothetical protein
MVGGVQTAMLTIHEMAVLRFDNPTALAILTEPFKK